VSDVAWVRTAAAAFSLAYACPVRVFADADAGGMLAVGYRNHWAQCAGAARDVIEVRLNRTDLKPGPINRW